MPWRLVLVAALLPACASAPPESDRRGVYTADSPSADERFCAWYGDADDEVLYFGQSAFWSNYRANAGRASADLDLAGPAWIGRFDFRSERFLPPLDVGGPNDRSGVWDVLAHPNGQLYFTTFFGTAGRVDRSSGRVERFEAAGVGLNELALGPNGSILASRYGAPDTDAGSGGIALLDAAGEVKGEFPLLPPPGYLAAPKTVAFDHHRSEIWVTTDLLPIPDGEPGPVRHDTYVLDSRGRELRRISQPEIQFVAFAADGTGYWAEVEGRELWLRTSSPPAAGTPPSERRVLLAGDFAPEVDFVQDIQFPAEGGVVLTRWSGWVHLADAAGNRRALRLPALVPDGLYYTAILRNGRVCATYCGGVSVVCEASIPEP